MLDLIFTRKYTRGMFERNRLMLEKQLKANRNTCVVRMCLLLSLTYIAMNRVATNDSRRDESCHDGRFR